MKTIFNFFCICLASFVASAQYEGTLVKVDDFESKFVKARNVEIWLPKEYFENEDQRFPVLYMQDGQNVFNPETSTHNIAWQAGETAEKLIAEEIIEPFIIVAIWSSGLRYYEYFPEKAAEHFSNLDHQELEELRKQMGMPESEFLGDEYLQFLTSELKPYIDENYRTLKTAKHTSVAGSSMGGLISLYAICEYPHVFGQAACVSTHWPVLFDNTNMSPSDAIRAYMEENLPNPESHRIYFDHGTETLDQYYGIHQDMVDYIMKNKGYTEGTNWVTKKFDDAEHNEKSWQERLDVILTFLYGKKQ